MSSEKTYTFSFSGGMTYNYLDIDRSTASPDLVSQINGDTTSGAKTLFLQSFYGSFIRLQMPNIRDFANIADGKRIVINQASLVMNVKPNATFPPASSLNIGYVKSNDTVIALSDQTLSIGGTYNESKSEYRLYLTRHIQNLLLNAENVPLTIYSNTRSSLPDITTIYGPDRANGDKRMRLEIAYTILPE